MRNQPEVEQAINVVHPKEVFGIDLCRQADTKEDYSNNE